MLTPCIGAAGTYYNSVLGVSQLKTTGKYAAKIALQKRKNRLMRVHSFHLQKLKKRHTAFVKTNSLSQAQKERWAPCVVAETMSSEESDDENEVFVVRPLPWRSDKVDSLFSSLDMKFDKKRSKKRSIVQMAFHRIVLGHLVFQTGP